MHGVVDPYQTAKTDVIVVEDEGGTRRALSLLLELNGFITAAAASAEEALSMLSKGAAPTFVLVDLDLPGMNGIEFINCLQKSGLHVQPVLLTAADKDRVARIPSGRKLPYLQKPIDFAKLLQMLRRLQIED